MKTFEIRDEFYLNGQPLKIISGAIHYFRLPREQWEDSLYNLKALGANTVETYIPWNIHEPVEGEFDFSGRHDIEAFIKTAEELGLLVILRPSVYICAEWEFGGLPAWLLKEPGVRLRSTDPRFMMKVRTYFSVLLPKLAKYQLTQGGPVIMMQIENEYGSYGMEKAYLRETCQLMKEFGVEVPLFTSDGAWDEVLDAGTLIDEDIFVAGNFGSRSKESVETLRGFHQRHGKKWPIMCMEFWDGWFNRWGEEIIRRDSTELASEVKDMLELGSINLYMFHGGTNFGFYNGCSARGDRDLPQVTSYDYDALLTEWGEPTAKYYAVQQAIHEVCPDVWQAEPRTKEMKALGSFEVSASVSLFNTLESFAVQTSAYPLSMEVAGNGYGYLLYALRLKNYHRETKLKVIEASDRVQVYLNQTYQATQGQGEIGEVLTLLDETDSETTAVNVLVENLGRVNYGHKLNAPTQRKGIRGGVMHDIHFHQGYTHYPLDFQEAQLNAIDFSGASQSKTPSFYRIDFALTDIADTFIDCTAYGKGVVIVNGTNLGRYWHRGPIRYLYCPKEFLKEQNEVIIFETEGIEVKTLKFTKKPVYLEIPPKE